MLYKFKKIIHCCLGEQSLVHKKLIKRKYKLLATNGSQTPKRAKMYCPFLFSSFNLKREKEKDSTYKENL